MQPELAVVEFEPSHAKDFAALNLEWLEELFVVEDIDRELLSDPQAQIIDRGGHVLMGVLDGRAVATVALLRHDIHTFELSKMSVTKSLHGRGFGRVLLEACLELAHRLGCRRLLLYTNSSLHPAIRLYETVGFRHVELEPNSAYGRADVKMELLIEGAGHGA